MTILSSRKANVNTNTGGGDKKQGLAPKATSYFRSSLNGSQYSTQTGSGEDRFKLVCMNQIGGIGKGKSQFASNADGAKCPIDNEEYDITSVLQDIEDINKYIQNELKRIIGNSSYNDQNQPILFELCFVGIKESFLGDIMIGGGDLKKQLNNLRSDISGHIFTHLYSDSNQYTIYIRTDMGTDTGDYNSYKHPLTLPSNVMNKINKINNIIKYPRQNILVPSSMKDDSRLGLHTLGLLNNNYKFERGDGTLRTAGEIMREDGFGNNIWPVKTDKLVGLHYYSRELIAYSQFIQLDLTIIGSQEKRWRTSSFGPNGEKVNPFNFYTFTSHEKKRMNGILEKTLNLSSSGLDISCTSYSADFSDLGPFPCRVEGDNKIPCTNTDGVTFTAKFILDCKTITDASTVLHDLSVTNRVKFTKELNDSYDVNSVGGHVDISYTSLFDTLSSNVLFTFDIVDVSGEIFSHVHSQIATAPRDMSNAVTDLLYYVNELYDGSHNYDKVFDSTGKILGYFEMDLNRNNFLEPKNIKRINGVIWQIDDIKVVLDISGVQNIGNEILIIQNAAYNIQNNVLSLPYNTAYESKNYSSFKPTDSSFGTWIEDISAAAHKLSTIVSDAFNRYLNLHGIKITGSHYGEVGNGTYSTQGCQGIPGTQAEICSNQYITNSIKDSLTLAWSDRGYSTPWGGNTANLCSFSEALHNNDITTLKIMMTFTPGVGVDPNGEEMLIMNSIWYAPNQKVLGKMNQYETNVHNLLTLPDKVASAKEQLESEEDYYGIKWRAPSSTSASSSRTSEHPGVEVSEPPPVPDSVRDAYDEWTGYKILLSARQSYIDAANDSTNVSSELSSAKDAKTLAYWVHYTLECDLPIIFLDYK
tara:strand:+ start:657 stop:3263 length:2607 start_codon:yes stop_codon:yes gene_type:complete